MLRMIRVNDKVDTGNISEGTVLPAVWYWLHQPRSRFQLVSFEAQLIAMMGVWSRCVASPSPTRGQDPHLVPVLAHFVPILVLQGPISRNSCLKTADCSILPHFSSPFCQFVVGEAVCPWLCHWSHAARVFTIGPLKSPKPQKGFLVEP